jgi:D-alanyl-D-alanine carboxypeptidase
VNLVISNNTPQSFEERWNLIDFKMKPLNSFHYSNSNYLFLEKIVEQITGKTYDQAFNQFYHEEGLPAIKMITAVDSTPTFFAQESNESSDVTATQETYGYAGDVHTNSGELLNLLKKLFVEKSLLKPDLMDELQQWVSMKSMTIPIGTGIIDQYGIGIMKLTFKNKVLLGHSGGTLKYQSFLFYNPENSTILIGLTNSSGTHYNNSFIQRILPAALERM